MTTLNVPDMTCGHCKASVEAALTPLTGSVTVDLAKKQVTVPAEANPARLIAALEAIGFPAQVAEL